MNETVNLHPVGTKPWSWKMNAEHTCMLLVDRKGVEHTMHWGVFHGKSYVATIGVKYPVSTAMPQSRSEPAWMIADRIVVYLNKTR